MVTYDVQVEGSSVDALLEVSTSSEDEGAIGKATALIGNTPSNRNIRSGDDAAVYKNGSIEFRGKVIGDPRFGDDNAALELVIADGRYELQKLTVNRPFYQMDTGEILREAINKQIRPLSREYISLMEDDANWSTEAEEFTTTDFDSDKYREYGDNMLFLGWRKGAFGVYKTTFAGVPNDAIPGDGQIQELVTRFLVNNRGQKFNVEVGLCDNVANQYVWAVENPRSGFEEYNLKAQEARTSGSLIEESEMNPGTLMYAVDIQGTLGEPRAILLDVAYTKPFLLDDRTPSLDPAKVQDSGRVITRRFDESVFEMFKTFSTEDNATSYVTLSDELVWEPAGQTLSEKSIDYATTPIVNADIDRDYDSIVNEVTVQGAGNIQVTVTADSSIQFYGISSRQEPITDKDIQTESEAIDRGRGYLEDNAWTDTALSFTIADTSYSTVRVGEAIPVEWNPPGGDSVIGEFIVGSVTQDDTGYITITMSGNYTS